jgi:NhaP-type Na+/H+ or K+/H+ antiporter
LLASILAPTDAALGQAVVSNPLVPVRIRQSLNADSGLNDGIVLPVVLVLASLAGAREASGDATYWLHFAALAVTLGPLVGAAVGYIGGRIVAWGTESGWINDVFQRLAGLGVATLAFGAAELVGGNRFISAFVAGLTLGNTARGVCECLLLPQMRWRSVCSRLSLGRLSTARSLRPCSSWRWASFWAVRGSAGSTSTERDFTYSPS